MPQPQGADEAGPNSFLERHFGPIVIGGALFGMALGIVFFLLIALDPPGDPVPMDASVPVTAFP